MQFIIRYKAREFRLKDAHNGSPYWAAVFRALPTLQPFVFITKPPIFIGSVLVAAAPSQGSLRKAAEMTGRAGMGNRPNLRAPLPLRGLQAVRLGLGRASEASVATPMVTELREAQVLGAVTAGEYALEGEEADEPDGGEEEFESERWTSWAEDEPDEEEEDQGPVSAIPLPPLSPLADPLAHWCRHWTTASRC